MPGQWENSPRRSELTPLFYRLRPKVLARDRHMCQWVDPPDERISRDYSSAVRTYVDPKLIHASTVICGERATDVDHISGYEDTMDNLQSLCSYHHDKKSSAQGNEARWQHREARAKERHSGIKD